MRKPDLLPALGVNPSPVTERFAGSLPTPVAGFGSARRPGLGPVTPTAERLGVIV